MPQFEPTEPSLRRLAFTQATAFGVGLGLLGLGVYLAWLSLPSRLPALGLAGLLAALVGLRWYVQRRLQGLAVRVRAEYLALAGILVGAALLRFRGLSQNLPYLDNPDEPTLTNAAIKMLQTGDLNPHFFRWPSLPFYLQLAVSVPQFLGDVGRGVYSDLNGISPAGFVLAGRTLVAGLGVATVWVTYLLGRTLYGPGVGLLAALILAVLPLHSEHSHYLTPDVTVTFFATLTLLFAAWLYRTGQRRWYLWAGVVAGLTLGSKYNVGIVLLTVVLAHFLTPRERRGRPLWLGASVGLALLTFLATTPFALFDSLGFLNELTFQIRHYTITGHGGADEGPSWSAYLRAFWLEGFPFQASFIALGGVGLALVRQRREDWLVVSLPLVGYFFFSTAKVFFARNLLPLLPPLAVLSAVFLVTLAGWLLARSGYHAPGQERARKWRSTGLVAGLWLVFFFFGLLNCVLTDRYYSQPDTRVLAGEWIVRNLPAGAKIRLEAGTPVLPADRYKNANEQRPIGAHEPDWYRQQGFDYLVASSGQYLELSQNDAQARENYRQVFEQFGLVQEFKEARGDRPGPTIRIYKVKK